MNPLLEVRDRVWSNFLASAFHPNWLSAAYMNLSKTSTISEYVTLTQLQRKAYVLLIFVPSEL